MHISCRRVLPCSVFAGILCLTLLLSAAKGGFPKSGRLFASEPNSAASLRQTLSIGSTGRVQLAENYGKLPLQFEPNEGQTDARVRFLSHGDGYTLFLTDAEAIFRLQRGSSLQGQRDAMRSLNPPHPVENAVLRMKLVGANPASRVSGRGTLQGRSNYFLGGASGQWRRNIPTFSQVRYQQAYPGIDLVYYGNQQQLEYDFVVAPGADPGAISLDVQSDRAAGKPGKVVPLRIAANGDLLVSVGDAELSFHRPVVYQADSSAASDTLGADPQSEGRKKTLPGRWVLKTPTQVGFEVPDYDRRKPLIIDPALAYSTYLGGTKLNTAYSIAVDNAGDAYLTGTTTSTDFPTKNPAQSLDAGSYDAFVVKLNPAGTGLIYSTYLGGKGVDFAFSIGIDTAGNAYVVGTTGSSNFPTTAGSFQTVCGNACLKGTPDVFVTKLDSTGAVAYSTYLGGSGDDRGYAIAVDSTGHAFVTGKTSSVDFPVTAGAFQDTLHGITNIFVTELNPAGSALVYSTYLGGSSVDQANAIALNPVGNAYVAGSSTSTNFPTTPGAFQSTRLGPSNAVVAGVNATGTGLVLSTYLGGSGTDIAWGVHSDSSGNAYLAGQTSSPNFPTTSGAIQTTCAGGCAHNNAFVSKLNPTGTTLGYSTFLGGTGETETFAMTVDGTGDAYVTGRTNSADFHVTPGAFSVKNQGSFDAIVSVLNPTGTSLLYSTYLGGNASDNGLGIAVTGRTFYLVGRTFSPNFPTTPKVFDSTCNSCAANEAAFVAKFVTGDQVWPMALNFGNATVGVTSSPLVTKFTNSGSAAVGITGVTISGTNAADFKENNTCGSSLAAGASCSISVTVNPASTGPFSASLSITDAAANSPQTVLLSGTGTTSGASLTPTSLTFATQVIKTDSPSRAVTLKSTGTTALNISQIAVSGQYTQLNNCGPSLTPGSTCTINVTFHPTTSGSQQGTLSVTDDGAGSPQSVTLTGTATVMSFSAASLNFGNQAKNTSSSPRTVTMTNVGSSAVSISKIAITGLQETSFSETHNCGGSLAAGANCSIAVTFTPQATGASNATLSVSDTGGSSPQGVTLTGNGT